MSYCWRFSLSMSSSYAAWIWMNRDSAVSPSLSSLLLSSYTAQVANYSKLGPLGFHGQLKYTRNLYSLKAIIGCIEPWMQQNVPETNLSDLWIWHKYTNAWKTHARYTWTRRRRRRWQPSGWNCLAILRYAPLISSSSEFLTMPGLQVQPTYWPHQLSWGISWKWFENCLMKSKNSSTYDAGPLVHGCW